MTKTTVLCKYLFVISSFYTDNFTGFLIPIVFYSFRRNRRLGDHIRKCRTNYEISKSKDGEVPLTVRCRYNMQHKVYAPELLRHEQWCSDKQTAWLERFYHQNVETLEAILRYDASATEHLPGSMANKNENSEKATEQDKVISQLLDEVFTKNLPVSHFGM